ncbi:MAG: hypothetical protein IKH49_07150, partial [Bacteroidales bacterium]|nr:hypothetical protein [Bacteroidales bacterium]
MVASPPAEAVAGLRCDLRRALSAVGGGRSQHVIVADAVQDRSATGRLADDTDHVLAAYPVNPLVLGTGTDKGIIFVPAAVLGTGRFLVLPARGHVEPDRCSRLAPVEGLLLHATRHYQHQG